ncbi:MAG: hypothetical protein QOG84_2335 [Sphingomonadales bacterium]|jgi:hypothetical protein|nr:hypothetical protein [Sphingomonadales bacterium]
MRLLLSSVFGIALLGLVLLAAGCAQQGPPHRFRGHGEGMGRRGPTGPGMGPRPSLFVSPAGEPFRGAPGQPAPLAAWFAQADSDGDGAIGFAEFQADFRRWFAALDTNHDGEIAPDEVTRYETEILPEMASGRGGFGGGGMGARGGGMNGRGGGWGGRGGGGRGGMGGHGGGGMRGGPGGGGGEAMAYHPSGAARFGLLPIPHPIMAADEDLNRGISVAEWDHAAASRFNMLDEVHDGRLTLAELSARRMRTFEERRGARRGAARQAPGQPEAE